MAAVTGRRRISPAPSNIERRPSETAAREISVVLFDLDDTLFDHRRSVELGITAHRSSLGGDLAEADPAVEFARWNSLEEHHYHRYLSGELEFLGQRPERAKDFVAPYGIELDDDAA